MLLNNSDFSIIKVVQKRKKHKQVRKSTISVNELSPVSAECDIPIKVEKDSSLDGAGSLNFEGCEYSYGDESEFWKSVRSTNYVTEFLNINASGRLVDKIQQCFGSDSPVYSKEGRVVCLSSTHTAQAAYLHRYLHIHSCAKSG